MNLNKKFLFIIFGIFLLFFIIISLKNYDIILVGDVLQTSRANFSVMANASTDFFAPSITIINPSGFFANSSGIPIQVVFDDNQILDVCWYKITNLAGDLIGVELNRINCTGGQGTFEVPPEHNSFIFYAFANDTAGNQNSTNSRFDVNFTGSLAKDGRGVKGIELFVIKPKSFKFNLQLDETILSSLYIRSQSTSKLKFYVSVEGLEDFIKLKERQFDLNSAEEKILDFYVFGKELGVFSGKLLVLGGRTLKEVPIILNVESKERFFDVKVNVKEDSKIIINKYEVAADVKITALKKIYPSYAEVYYTIKDFKGNIIVQERENNVLIEDIKQFEKTVKLPLGIQDGSYIFIVQVVNLDSMAADSDFFVVNNKKIVFETPLEIVIPKPTTLLYLLLILILIIISHYTIFNKKKPKSSDLLS